jgi:hypothetical protein
MLENLFFRRNRKIEKILNNKIILINKIEEKYANLCLKNYGLPLKVKERDKVQVIFPRLTPKGDVEYIFSWHNLDDVEIPEVEIAQNNITLRAAKELAPLIKEHLQIEQEIASLEEQLKHKNVGLDCSVWAGHSARKTNRVLLRLALVGQLNASRCHNLDQYNIAHWDDAFEVWVQSNLLKECFGDAPENFSQKYHLTLAIGYGQVRL